MLLYAAISFFIFAQFMMVTFSPHWIKRGGSIYGLIWVAFGVSLAATAFMPYWSLTVPLTPGPHISNANAAKILFLFLAVGFFIEAMTKKETWRRFTIDFLFLFMVVDIVWLFIVSFGGINRAMMDAYTFDSAMALIIVWIYLAQVHQPKFTRYVAYMIGGLSGYLGGYTVVLCLVSGIAASIIWQLYAQKISFLFVSIAVSFMSLLSGVGVVFLSNIETAQVRFEIWSQHLTPMFGDTNLMLFGHGAGSFEWYGLMHPVDGVRYVIMHNDYLQIFYEFGLPLALLFVLFVGLTIWGLRDKPMLFVAAVMYAASMTVYHPLHFAATILLGAYLVAQAFIEHTEPNRRFEL